MHLQMHRLCPCRAYEYMQAVPQHPFRNMASGMRGGPPPMLPVACMQTLHATPSATERGSLRHTPSVNGYHDFGMNEARCTRADGLVLARGYLWLLSATWQTCPFPRLMP